MNFIRKHKGVLIVCAICIILIALAVGAVYRIFNPNSDKTVYGDRLENAPIIDNAVIEQIKDEIVNSNLVEEVKYETNVVVMKFYIDVKKDTKVEDAQKLGNIILEKLNADIISFYDIQVYLTQKSGEDVSYPAIGYHSKNAEIFSWTLNKAGESNE